MPDIDQLYESYRTDPTPAALNEVVRAADPLIRYSLSTVNALDNPNLRSRAKLFTVDAIQKYDPSRGASLRTHIGNNLMQLRRAAREVSTPQRVPERLQLEAGYLQRKELEFRDQHGREPDLHELADSARMPVSRISSVRQNLKSMPSEAALGSGELGETSPDYLTEAMQYAYHDADYIDRKILELRGGYGGNSPLPPNVVGAQLGLTPSQLSRRSARLALRMSAITNMLESA